MDKATINGLNAQQPDSISSIWMDASSPVDHHHPYHHHHLQANGHHHGGIMQHLMHDSGMQQAVQGFGSDYQHAEQQQQQHQQQQQSAFVVKSDTDQLVDDVKRLFQLSTKLVNDSVELSDRLTEDNKRKIRKHLPIIETQLQHFKHIIGSDTTTTTAATTNSSSSSPPRQLEVTLPVASIANVVQAPLPMLPPPQSISNFNVVDQGQSPVNELLLVKSETDNRKAKGGELAESKPKQQQQQQQQKLTAAAVAAVAAAAPKKQKQEVKKPEAKATSNKKPSNDTESMIAKLDKISVKKPAASATGAAAGAARPAATAVAWNDAVERKVFVNRVPPNSSESDLRKVFEERFGAVQHIQMPPANKVGFCVVTFVKSKSVRSSLAAPLIDYDGVQLRVQEFNPEHVSKFKDGGDGGSDPEMKRDLFIRGLPKEAKWQEIKDYFSSTIGRVLNARKRMACARFSITFHHRYCV